ncbi:MAG: hypothetical protein GC162_07985 [Planctomycetes bacterium]|nr:hypothetical protein [Planctomycetota bacterium]
MTSNLFYIASVCGALAVYLMLPHRRTGAKVGALLGLATLAALFANLAKGHDALHTPGVYFYIFSFISLAAAVRVISHPRPVYSALYFVLVVLSTAGMLVLLQSEFMAFAMIIIYGGAILITYMFVIMLATLPQSAQEMNTAAPYDLRAREPLMAVVMGFLLIAVLGNVIFLGEPVQPRFAAESASSVAALMPRRVNASRLETILRQQGLITTEDHLTPEAKDDIKDGFVLVRSSEGARPKRVALTPKVMGEFITNIDYVGLDLFKGHTLGIELAGVVLLLSMVGAIVIARQRVPEAPNENVH